MKHEETTTRDSNSITMSEIDNEKVNAFLDKLRSDLEKKKQEQIELYHEVDVCLARLAENAEKCKQLEHTINITIPDKIKELELEKAHYLEILAEINAKLAKIAEELLRLIEEKEVLVAKSKIVKSALNDSEVEISKLEGQIDSLEGVEEEGGDQQDVNEEINKQLALRDEIRNRLKSHEEELKKDRNSYNSILISLSDLEQVIAKNQIQILKQNQTIETLEAELALENSSIASLQISSKIIGEEITELERLKKLDTKEKSTSWETETQEYKENHQKRLSEKEILEKEQRDLEPNISVLEDEQQEMVASYQTAEASLKSTNTVFDSFFGSLYSFILTPNKFYAERTFSGNGALVEKRALLRNQLSSLNQGFKKNAADIITEKNKVAEYRDKIYKQRNEITLCNQKIQKNRNFYFMLDKTEEQIQESIDDKNSMIEQNNSAIAVKNTENERRKAAIAEARDKLSKLEKESDLKRNEIENLRNNQQNDQEKIIKAALLYDQAFSEFYAFNQELNIKEKSTKVLTQRFDLEKQLRSLLRQHREKIKENEALNFLITSFEEYIVDKKNEEKPILNEKKLTLQAINDIEASIDRENNDRELLIREKIEVENDSRRLEERLEHLREKIEINKLTIRAKEEIIELNQPFIPNITAHSTFY